MTKILWYIIITPLTLVIETIFDVIFDLLGNAGLSVIGVSLAVNLLVLPLYLRADRVQQLERDRQKQMAPYIRHLKKTFRGNEQYMMLSTFYRQNRYSPLQSLRGTFSLLLQIPFFMAAYHFLSGLSLLSDARFLAIRNLAAPDRLISSGAWHINLLPVLMTLLNVLSTLIYTRGAAWKEKLQAYALAALFLVLLYDSPSGLVLYWTCSQLFSIVKNLVMARLAKRHGNARKKTRHGRGTGKRRVRTPENALPSPDAASPAPYLTALFIASALFLTLLTGALIPSALIADSPLEFTSIRTLENPAAITGSTLCVAAGCFLFWGGVCYVLASGRGKQRIAVIFCALCAVSVIDYMAFGKNPGVLSRELVFDTALSYPVPQVLLNLTAVLLAVCAVWLAVSPGTVLHKKHSAAPSAVTGKSRRITVTLLTVCCIAFALMSLLNIRAITHEVHRSFPEQALSGTMQNRGKTGMNEHNPPRTDTEGNGRITPVIPLSRNGKNVVILMLDRAISGYIPYIMEEKPALAKQFSGFVYYPNTISHGGFTVFGAPALFGGYDYTVTETNKRKDEPLVKKHNEALKVLPVLFSENGFDVTVCDPPYAGYRWIPDLSIYGDCDGVNAYITEGVYTDTISAPYDARREQNQARNFFCYSLFKSSPLVLQPAVYAEGTYHSPHGVNDIPDGFLKAYSALANIIPLSEVRDDAKNRFLMLSNSTPHEPVFLLPPDYTISADAGTRLRQEGTASGSDKNRTSGAGGSFTLPDGSSMRMETDWQLSHYHVNMAALLRVGEWLDWMREQGIYDNTRIIIASDHGRHLGQFDSLLVDGALDAELLNALLMVKDFGTDAAAFPAMASAASANAGTDATASAGSGTDATASAGSGTNATASAGSATAPESPLTVSMKFMTNADVPFLAADGVIDNPVNPFSGNPLDGTERKKVPQIVTSSKNWRTTKQHGHIFDTSDGYWYTVHDNIFDRKNWTRKD